MTLRMCLIGRDISHSLSPVLYRAGFDCLGIAGEYEARDCATPEEALAVLQSGDFDAVNITTPYKRLALDAAGDIDPAAAVAGGANLLVSGPAATEALNTDGSGCIGDLIRRGIVVDRKAVAVCGTGPTARAIAAAALSAGAAVGVLSRAQERAEQAADALAGVAAGGMAGGRGPSGGDVGERAAVSGWSYDSAGGKNIISCADVIIDATTCGMAPGDPAPFDTSLLSARQVVVDTVYGHGLTETVRAAQEAGAGARDGLGMLVMQAVIGLQLVAARRVPQADLSFQPLYHAMADAVGCDPCAQR